MITKLSNIARLHPRLLGFCLAGIIAGCASPPHPAATSLPAVTRPTPAQPAPLPPPAPVGSARIKGSEEKSALLDNFTVFITAVDGQPVAAGRAGWESPLEIKAGRRVLAVEFNRGVFVAHTTLELEAAADASYEVRFSTDAQLFGHNSFCDFWIVDSGTGKTVTAIRKATVTKKP